MCVAGAEKLPEDVDTLKEILAEAEEPGVFADRIASGLDVDRGLEIEVLLTLDEPLARSRGVAVSLHRLLFLILLAVVVAISIKAVGVLLISAFVVIPACASRLVSRRFGSYVALAAALGAACAVLGLLLSAAFALPSGPCVVIAQLVGFLSALAVAPLRGLGATA